MSMKSLQQRAAEYSQTLKEYLRSLKKLMAVAFFERGLHVSFENSTMCWGCDVARLLPYPVLSRRELEEAKTFCEKEGIRHISSSLKN